MVGPSEQVAPEAQSHVVPLHVHEPLHAKGESVVASVDPHPVKNRTKAASVTRDSMR